MSDKSKAGKEQKAKLGNPYPFKFERDVELQMRATADQVKAPFPFIVRMAMRRGLPLVRKQFLGKGK